MKVRKLSAKVCMAISLDCSVFGSGIVVNRVLCTETRRPSKLKKDIDAWRGEERSGDCGIARKFR